MSMERTVDITCPDCGKTSDFVIWQSINTQIDPEMKQAVRDRSAFLFTCPHCGNKHNVDYGFLYHQMEDRIMIHYATSDEEAQDVCKMYSSNAGIDPMLVNLRAENYMIRIVRSQNQLLEKLAIIDAGLDDRLVELYKLFLLADMLKDKPELNGAEILEYNADGKHYLDISSGHKHIGYAELSMETYQLLVDRFSAKLPDRRAQKPFVDRKWALEFLESHK